MSSSEDVKPCIRNVGEIDTGMTLLTEYETQRLEHIRRNQEFMARLGIPTTLRVMDDRVQTKPTRPRKLASKIEVDPESLRRSGRHLGHTPDYTGESIDQLGDADVKVQVGRKRAYDGTASEEREREMREVLDNSRRWLQESRDALLKVCNEDGEKPSNSGEWKVAAERRWGAKVAAMDVPDWELYVMSRLSTPPPPSPNELMQEFYAHDTWQLLICCVLMSRVSSHNVKHNTIAAFFKRYPTPSDALDADPEEVLRIITPLGLFPTRMRSIVEVSRHFLEMPEFILGLKPPYKVYGIGEFGYHSYLLFCRSNFAIAPGDRALKAFVEWQKRQLRSAKPLDEAGQPEDVDKESLMKEE
mmetsp:Transcript_16948/g.28616  ORF Transcript_16948/g.28616 Transcript_16948/m.28616 type:complete len:358 (+) Transcript_16948:263-1336(+)